MIHPSSLIHPEAQIDSTVEVGPFCTIGAHVKVGARTRLISHVVLDGHTEIGSDNVIYPYATLGLIPQDLKYKGEPTKLIIGNNNNFREGMSAHPGTVGGGGVTRIGDGNLLMGYTHVGHDCILGNNCIIANFTGLAGHVTLMNSVTIGGQCGISQFTRLGEHSFIGGQSGVDKDIPPYCIAIGCRPCNIKGTNIVGLRRRGFSAELIHILNESAKLWTRQDVQSAQCLLEIESQYGERKEVQEMLNFIRSSKIGVIR